MSKRGRFVMNKLVLSSLPTYYISVFGVPIGVARKLEKYQRDFFWGDGAAKRKIHSVDWLSVCKSKRNGSSALVGSMIKGKVC